MDFLFLYADQEYETFREAEFASLLDLSGVEFDLNSIANHNWGDCFLVVSMRCEEDVQRLIDRSVLIKSAYKIWVQSDDMEKLCEEVDKLPSSITKKFDDEDSPLRCDVEVMHKKMTSDEKIAIIEQVLNCHTELKARRVSLKDPKLLLGIILDFPYDKKRGCVIVDKPQKIYYGHKVGQSQRCTFINRYKLSKRQFIGNTSMEVRLAFLMANIGRVATSQLVLDPFVGTGSILVAAAHFGAKVVGSDIDYKVVHGLGKSTKANEVWRAKEECLRLNFQQYGLLSNFVDIFVADASRLDKVLKPDLLFDVILTDPPYGVREKSLKLMKLDTRPHMNDPQVPHFPQKETYQMASVFGDLLSLAARRIRLGGYLVMWLPLIRASYTTASLPRHASMQLLHNCEQVLNKNASRRLLAYRKVSEPDQYAQGVPAGAEMLNETFRKTYLSSQ